jgi:3-oxoacyl-[acyl-carrier protein] reductase
MSGGQDRAVLVTGASRGIGAAIARAFASGGDRVAVHFGQSRDEAERVAASLAGLGHCVVGADLADAAAIRRMVDDAADRLSGLDVLVNNAGVFRPHPITETSYKDWQRAWEETLRVNLLGAANVSWCAAQHMITSDGGSIVNVSSRGAFRGEPKQAAYGASKAGLVALTGSLSRRSRQGSSRRTWPLRTSLVSSASKGARKVLSGGSRLPRKWPQRSSF